ncbi:hypothetical protein SEA_MAGRITTE_70 [Microbacterium phage Magritte]|nr:hypothetical protein SEA_MAGRITTE_70 [Microbacterium phage Magritte]
MNEHPRDIVHTFDVDRHAHDYPERVRLQLRRDGSVTWTPIPLEELSMFVKTYDTKTESVQRGTPRR